MKAVKAAATAVAGTCGLLVIADYVLGLGLPSGILCAASMFAAGFLIGAGDGES